LRGRQLGEFQQPAVEAVPAREAVPAVTDGMSCGSGKNSWRGGVTELHQWQQKEEWQGVGGFGVDRVATVEGVVGGDKCQMMLRGEVASEVLAG
jgi:hypothetical protein